MKITAKVHMTRQTRALYNLDIQSKGPNVYKSTRLGNSFPRCPTCYPKPLTASVVTGKAKVRKCQVGSTSRPRYRNEMPARISAPTAQIQANPEEGGHVVSPSKPPTLEAVRQVVQFRVVIRSLLTEFGQAMITRFFERFKSPIPTIDIIFKEELHSYWIQKGQLHLLPVDEEGNRVVATPAPEWGIVNANESAETIWSTAYKTILKKLDFVDLTADQ